MLQLSLAYVVQADREREVLEDLRNRQSLLPPPDTRTASPAASRQLTTARQIPVRARNTGA